MQRRGKKEPLNNKLFYQAEIVVFFRLLLLFTLVPFVELVILLQLSEWHGWLTTILLIIVTGIIGTALARYQGFEVWRKIQKEMSSGKPPTDSLMDGVMILIAGTLLITPGVLTDIVGFLLLWPSFRRFVKGYAKIYLANHARVKVQSTFQGFGNQFQQSVEETPRQTHDAHGNEIIDVEYTVKD